MRLLCDQHVARKYRQAFEQEHWVTCTTVREMLAPDARDVDIAGFAAANDWVVFTNDDDFYGPNVPHGLVIYSQIEDPPPSDVVLAIAAINDAYVDATEIEEYVPDGWV